MATRSHNPSKKLYITRQDMFRLVELSFPEYAHIRSEYWRAVNNAITGYLEEPTKDDDWFKGVMRLAVEVAFLRAALVAVTDGLEGTELTTSLLAFVTSYKLAEFGFVESLLLSLRLIKHPTISPSKPGEELPPIEEAPTPKPTPLEEAQRELLIKIEAAKRADGYAQGLDILYNNVKVRSAGERMLLFTGDDGMESCYDCQLYKGQKHPASWWVSHDAIPPNRNFECKGYRCLHILQDVLTGKIFTL